MHVYTVKRSQKLICRSSGFEYGHDSALGAAGPGGGTSPRAKLLYDKAQ